MRPIGIHSWCQVCFSQSWKSSCFFARHLCLTPDASCWRHFPGVIAHWPGMRCCLLSTPFGQNTPVRRGFIRIWILQGRIPLPQWFLKIEVGTIISKGHLWSLLASLKQKLCAPALGSRCSFQTGAPMEGKGSAASPSLSRFIEVDVKWSPCLWWWTH